SMKTMPLGFIEDGFVSALPVGCGRVEWHQRPEPTGGSPRAMSVVEAESLITDALGRLPAASTDRELVDEIETIGRLQNLLDARRLQLLPEADARGVCRQVGYTKMKAWVADTAGVTTTEAGGWLRLARSLQTAEHQPVNHALAAGAMSGGHARQIVKHLATLPADVDADTRV